MPRRSAEPPARGGRSLEQRGNVAVLTALMLVVLLGFAALAVDLSNKYRVRAESQSAVDAAALAGARELRGTAASMAAADQQARVIGEQHYAYRTDVTIAPGDIQLGNWAMSTRTFTSPAAPELTNAVRVQHSEPEVAHPFAAPLTGTASSAVGARAIALGGGPASVGCGFPLAIASCTLDGGAGGNNCGGCMRLAAAPSDNIGWANFNGNTSVPAVSAELRAACFGPDGTTPLLDEDDRCAATCDDSPVAGSDQMQLGNGNNFTRNEDHFCEMLKSLLRASSSGTVLAQVPVFQSGSAGACTPQFTGEHTVVGFAEVEFQAVRCGNADRAPFPATMPTGCGAPANNYIIARVECGTRANSPAGGGFFGLSARPVLVD